MYRTKDGEEIFVIDGHTHIWDGSPANQKNMHGQQFIDCFYAYHTALSPKEQVWPKEKFEKYGADQMYHDLFVDGYDDMAIVQPTYLTDFYTQRLQHDRANVGLMSSASRSVHRQRRLRSARRRGGARRARRPAREAQAQGREALHRGVAG